MSRELAKKIIKNESIISFFNLATKPVALFNSFFIIGLLSLNDFGLYKLVFSFYYLVSGFSIDFLDNLLLNEINVYHGRKEISNAKQVFREYAFLKIFAGLFLTMAIYFSSSIISNFYGNDIGHWIELISFLFIIENFKSILMILFQYKLKFFISSFYSFAIEFVKMVLFVFFVKFYHLGVSEALLISVIASLVVVLFMTVLFIFDYFKNRNERKEVIYEKGKLLLPGLIWEYGIWAIGRYYLLSFSQNIRPWIVKYFLGNEAVAIYSVAFDFSGNLKSLISLDSLKTFVPRELGNRERLKELFIRGGKYMTYVYGLFFIFGIIFVTVIIKLFFEKYNESLIYFYIISLTMFLYGISTIIGRIAYSLKMQKELFFIPFFTVGSTLFFSFLLVPFINLYGIAIEIVLTQFVLLFVSYKVLLKNRPELKTNFKEMLILDNQDKLLFFKGLNFLKVKLLQK